MMLKFLNQKKMYIYNILLLIYLYTYLEAINMYICIIYTNPVSN